MSPSTTVLICVPFIKCCHSWGPLPPTGPLSSRPDHSSSRHGPWALVSGRLSAAPALPSSRHRLHSLRPAAPHAHREDLALCVKNPTVSVTISTWEQPLRNRSDSHTERPRQAPAGSGAAWPHVVPTWVHSRGPCNQTDAGALPPGRGYLAGPDALSIHCPVVWMGRLR